MAQLIVLIGLIVSLASIPARALEIQFIAKASVTVPANLKKSSEGPWGGLVFDPTEGLFYSVSKNSESLQSPRFFKLKINLEPFQVELQNVEFLSVNSTGLSHSKVRKKASEFSSLFDLTAVSLTPWGDLIFTSRAPAQHKSQLAPLIFTSKKDGTIEKKILTPDDFQNPSFTAIAANSNNQEWIVSTEKADSAGNVSWIRYVSPEAWVLKPQPQRLSYPLANFKQVSDLVFLNDHRLLVRESSGAATLKELALFEVDLKAAGSTSVLQKTPVSVTGKLNPRASFEGMTLGPRLSGGLRSLILVSRDPSMRNQRTEFLLFSLKE